MSRPTVSCPSLTDAHPRFRDADETGHMPGIPREAGPLAGYVTAGVLYPAGGHITCQRPAAIQGLLPCPPGSV
jgi:hypothetical protein